LIAFVDAREQDFAEAPPADLKALEAHVEATAAALAELALERLGVGDPRVRQAGRHGAIAYGLTGVIRSIPAHAARRLVMLPGNVMAQEGLSPAAIGRKHAAPALARVVASVAELAEAHVEAARQVCPSPPRAAMPILLWVSLARSDLRRLRREAYDPYTPAVARGAAMRRFSITWRALTGRF
jgi:phytoene synthase